MTTALIVIDVQESFRQQPSWADISAPDITKRITRLVDAAREADHVVAWVLHTAPGSNGPFDPVNGLIELQPGLKRREGDITVLKTSHNAFTTTNLGQQLMSRKVDHLRIVGIRTEQCVETTARLASDMGYSVEVVIDATATHPLPLTECSGVLPADDLIARTAAALSGRFARITTIAEVVASWRP
ncbi:cysteine hydrolase family protein [Kocuria sp.]|uniref:cysteine hydrolase family protein n=1 Tax=Kocuria sp. TaxID=1871328 RepID=UPI0026DBB8B8|nr:isochorismatase family protein [Kocuria sp.]MDO4919609.1 isochorismatase family protein [Kocuria sp.]